MSLIASSVLALLLASPVTAEETKAATHDTAFLHVTVIDATGAPPRHDMTVLVSGGRISAIANAADAPVPEHARVVDGAGKYLIPGLWDMHVHMAWDDLMLRHRESLARLLVANGIVGVRDVGGDLKVLQRWRQEVESGTAIGPHVVAGGSVLVDPGDRWSEWSEIEVGTEAEGRKAVRDLKQRGADHIKVILQNREVYFAIASEANAQSIPFIGHVPGSVTTAEASDAGQKSIEHAGAVVRVARKSEGEVASLYERLVANSTWVCPTVVLAETTRRIAGGAARLAEPDPAADPRLRYLPSEWVERLWAGILEAMLKYDYMGDNNTPEGVTRNDDDFKEVLSVVGAMNAAGVKLLAGTDSATAPYIFPGSGLHEELALLVKAGLTPMEALQTATRNPAQYLGNPDGGGTVEVGKAADLLLLEANPLIDITNTRKIAGVMIGGRLYMKPDLERMLIEVEEWGR
jgi:imidazolonepropionase-like amidohydrolase